MNFIYLLLATIVLVSLAWFSWKKPRLSSILIWSLIATLTSTAAALLVIAGSFSSKALWIAFSVPIVWTAFQYWCYWLDSHWQVMWSLLLISVCSTVMIISVDPVI